MQLEYGIYRTSDFSCLDLLVNGFADSIGFIADHIPRIGSLTVVASRKESAVGYLLVTASEEGAYIHSVHVLEKYRHGGIATEMLKTIEGHISLVGKPLMLHVVESNTDAVSCYRKCGYEQVVRIPNHPECGDAMFVMQKNAKA